MAKRPTTPTRKHGRKSPPRKRAALAPPDVAADDAHEPIDADTLIDAIEGYAAARQTNGVIEALSSIATHRPDGQVDFPRFKREAPAVIRELMLAGRLPYLRGVDIKALIGAFALVGGGLGVDPDAVEQVLAARGRVRRPGQRE